jgi:hypothetical protein
MPNEGEMPNKEVAFERRKSTPSIPPAYKNPQIMVAAWQIGRVRR